MSAPVLDHDVVEVAEFRALGLVAFTTTRATGSFALTGPEPAADVWGRWLALAARVAPVASRLAFAHQVHGATVVDHIPGWDGILRAPDADGHLTLSAATAMAVSVADCVPVFIGHPSGAAGVVHSGWRGTVAGIAQEAIRRLQRAGHEPGDLRIHCGPAICGGCYEVSPDVYHALTGRSTERARPVDLRALIAEAARGCGVRHISISELCTRCNNDRLYSHRCGDAGRQLGVMATPGVR